jgi:hypothetical protein
MTGGYEGRDAGLLPLTAFNQSAMVNIELGVLPWWYAERLSHLTLFFYMRGMMYLLYVDESGSVKDKNCKYCVLAGFSVYETQPYWIEKEINAIIQRYLPTYPD